ncbi:hypothetical protein, partial [uncultured Cedecea sp.]|uniref:hypothetical protein n=1 Tax=uncultured Cedecea sp. TaxID=988762 RepID=UPI0026399535
KGAFLLSAIRAGFEPAAGSGEAQRNSVHYLHYLHYQLSHVTADNGHRYNSLRSDDDNNQYNG